MKFRAKPKVMIGVPCGKSPAYAHFYDCFAGVVAPPGSFRLRAEGGSVPKNLNTLVRESLNADCTHLFIVEDDSAFAPDTVMRLLDHKVPVVAGLCRSRTYPFRPYIYKGQNEDGLGWYRLQPEDKGLIGGEGWFAGMGGILIQTDVLKQFEYPWFECYFDEDGREWGQDNVFGKKIMDAGIPSYCDLDVIIRHKTDMVIGTKRNAQNEWEVILGVEKVGGGFIDLGFPQPDMIPK